MCTQKCQERFKPKTPETIADITQRVENIITVYRIPQKDQARLLQKALEGCWLLAVEGDVCGRIRQGSMDSQRRSNHRENLTLAANNANEFGCGSSDLIELIRDRDISQQVDN